MTDQSITVTDGPNEVERDVIMFFQNLEQTYGAERATDAFITVLTNVAVAAFGIPETVRAFRRHAELLEQQQQN